MEKHYSVEELIVLCEKHKIRRIKAGPNEIEMSEAAFQPPAEKGDEPIGPKTDFDFLAMGISPDMRDGLPELFKALEGKPPDGETKQ